MEVKIADSIYADPCYLDPCQKNPYFFSSHNLSYDLKETAIRACASVVGVISSVDGANIFHCSGFVVESVENNGKFISTIFTSASALRPESHIDAVAKDIEISVILCGGITCKGVLVGYDFHYNIGVITVETRMPIAISNLKYLDDSMSLHPESRDEELPQRHKFKLFPGDIIVALGRYYFERNGLMIVAGKFSVTQTSMDCENLLRGECVINRYGIGGPLINCYGEVIGINFFSECYTPFLPINIVSMWWKQIKKNRHFILPQHGMKLNNLYMEAVEYLELIRQSFPDISKGVVVYAVTLESHSCTTQILPSDVIIECGGKSVGSVLEFSELIWDKKVGEPVQLTLLRPSDVSSFHSTIIVGNVSPTELNRWPLTKLRTRRRRS